MKPLIVECSNCGRVADLYSGVKAKQLYENLCERCVGSFGSAEFARRYDRQWQRRHFAKDIIQPDEPAYIKAYGADQARSRGWSEDDIRKYG